MGLHLKIKLRTKIFMYQNKNTRLFVEIVRNIQKKKDKAFLILFSLYLIKKAYELRNKYCEVLNTIRLFKNLYQHYEENKKYQVKKEFKQIRKYYEHFKRTDMEILICFFSQLQNKIDSICLVKKTNEIRKQVHPTLKQMILRDNISIGVTKYFLVIYTLTFLRCFLKVKIFIIGRHVFAEEKKKKSLYKYKSISFDISKKSFKFLLCSFSLWRNAKLFELKEVFYQRFRTSVTKISLQKIIYINDVKKLLNECKLSFNDWLFKKRHFDLFILEPLKVKEINLRELEFLEMYGEVRLIIHLFTFGKIIIRVLKRTFIDFELTIHTNFQNKKINFSKIPFFLQYSCYLPIEANY